MKNQPNSPEVEDRIATNPQLVVAQQADKIHERTSSAGKDPLHQESKSHVHLAPPKEGAEDNSHHSINNTTRFSYKKITLKILLLYVLIIGLSALLVIIF